jgi:hypothetical protein
MNENRLKSTLIYLRNHANTLPRVSLITLSKLVGVLLALVMIFLLLYKDDHPNTLIPSLQFA